MALMYCKKCGRLIQEHYDNNDSIPCYCDCCNSVTYKVPTEFLISKSVPIIKSDLKQQFIEKYIKASSEFDQYLFDHRDEILAKQSADFNAKMEHGRKVLEEKSKSPKCPICGSTNINKITVGSRAVKTVIFGVVGAVDDAGKTYRCNNCGSKF